MICITIISSIMQRFFYNNKVKKFPVAFHERNVWKNWHTFWHVGKTFAMLAPQVEKLARGMTRWHVNMRIWSGLGTLANWLTGTLARKLHWHAGKLVRKSRWHASMFARRQRWHEGTLGTRLGKVKFNK